mmetsp:Transcript_3257/g.12438  ORF Transcript_3257/g.12438 Transcript_3257/m.12438 type:complete len:90 (+) Transcript_3257:298-567(+)
MTKIFAAELRGIQEGEEPPSIAEQKEKTTFKTHEPSGASSPRVVRDASLTQSKLTGWHYHAFAVAFLGNCDARRQSIEALYTIPTYWCH